MLYHLLVTSHNLLNKGDQWDLLLYLMALTVPTGSWQCSSSLRWPNLNVRAPVASEARLVPLPGAPWLWGGGGYVYVDQYCCCNQKHCPVLIPGLVCANMLIQSILSTHWLQFDFIVYGCKNSNGFWSHCQMSLKRVWFLSRLFPHVISGSFSHQYRPWLEPCRSKSTSVLL